jgi:hypothetical protein
MKYLSILVELISGIIITAPSLWFSGKTIVGEDKAKFNDALLIVALGIIVKIILETFFIKGIIVSLIQLVIWLYLVRKYFETDWVKAFIISIISVLVSIMITFVLAIIGIGIGAGIS